MISPEDAFDWRMLQGSLCLRGNQSTAVLFDLVKLTPSRSLFGSILAGNLEMSFQFQQELEALFISPRKRPLYGYGLITVACCLDLPVYLIIFIYIFKITIRKPI